MGISWSDELKTGIPIIDTQHQFIINALSGLQTSTLPKTELFQLLVDLQSYLSVHFASEEAYMLDTDYSGYEQHKKIHDKVLEDCKTILSQGYSEKVPSDIAYELINYMQSWFVDHYSNEDVKMVEHLKKFDLKD